MSSLLSYNSRIQEKIKTFFIYFEHTFPHWSGYIYILLFSVFYSLGSFFVKLLSRVPIFQAIHNSSLISLLLCIFTDSSNKIPQNQQVYKLLVQRGILGFIGISLYYQSLAYLPLSLAGLLLLITPLWLAIIGRLFYNEPYGIIHFFFTFLCFFGLILIIQPAFLFGKENLDHYDKKKFFLGVLFGVITSIINSLIFLTINTLKGKTNAVIILFYYNLTQILGGAFLSAYSSVVTLNKEEVLFIILVGVFFFLSQTARNRALFLETPFIVGIGSYSQLIINYLFDLLIFGTTLNWIANLGCGIVLFCIFFLMYKKNKK